MEEVEAEVLETGVRADDEVADEGGEGAVAKGGDVAGEAAFGVAGVGDEGVGGGGAADMSWKEVGRTPAAMARTSSSLGLTWRSVRMRKG